MAQHRVIATGIGSWPGTDVHQALQITFAESPDLPYLPELPARGAGADLTGRGVAMLSGLSADLQPAGWRLTSAAGHDQLQARSLLREDLDQLEEIATGYEGPFKVSFPGPWTLAGSVERPRGGRILGDHGARRDLAQSLAAGTAELLAELRRRLPSLELIAQLDEPLLPAVTAGRLATVSGYSSHRPVEPAELGEAIAGLVDAVRDSLGAPMSAADASLGDPRALPSVWLHCCAPGLEFQAMADAGVGGIAIDLDQLNTADLDTVGQLMNDGLWLGAGALPTSQSTAGQHSWSPDTVAQTVGQHSWSPDAVAQRVLRLIATLGLEPDAAARMVSTPTCGLAGFDERSAVTVLRTVGKAAKIVTEELGS